MAGLGASHPIRIVQLATNKDVNGNMVTAEVGVFAGWAEVKQTSSYRNFTNGITQMGAGKQFRIRFNQVIPADVNTRLVYDGKRFTIDSIEPEKEKHFYWIIRATALTDGERI